MSRELRKRIPRLNHFCKSCVEMMTSTVTSLSALASHRLRAKRKRDVLEEKKSGTLKLSGAWVLQDDA